MSKFGALYISTVLLYYWLHGVDSSVLQSFKNYFSAILWQYRCVIILCVCRFTESTPRDGIW